MDTRGKSVGSVVGLRNDFLGGVEFRNYSHGTKDFLPHNGHVSRNVGENSWLYEVTRTIDSITAGLDLGAGLFA